MESSRGNDELYTHTHTHKTERERGGGVRAVLLCGCEQKDACCICTDSSAGGRTAARILCREDIEFRVIVQTDKQTLYSSGAGSQPHMLRIWKCSQMANRRLAAEENNQRVRFKLQKLKM